MQDNLKAIKAMIAQIKDSGCERFTVQGADKQYDSTGHFFIWDDAKELLHMVYANPDVETQVQTPLCFASVPYNMLHRIDKFFTA